MSARSKSYAWAIAGMLPLAVIAWATAESLLVFGLLIVAAAWQHGAASMAERAQQAPGVADRERRIRFLQEDLRAAQDRYGDQARVFSRRVNAMKADKALTSHALHARDMKIDELRRELADRDERLLAAETAGVESLVQDLATGGALGAESG